MSVFTDGYFDGARDTILSVQNKDGSIPVSYTHLTLPTTPYV